MIHIDHFVQLAYTVDGGVLAWRILRLVNLLHERGKQDVSHQRALSAARYARDGNKASKRNFCRNVLQVVFTCAPDCQPIGTCWSAIFRHWNASFTAEILSGDGTRSLINAWDRPAVDHLATVLACTRANVYDPIAGANGVFIMLDNQNRVA